MNVEKLPTISIFSLYRYCSDLLFLAAFKIQFNIVKFGILFLIINVVLAGRLYLLLYRVLNKIVTVETGMLWLLCKGFVHFIAHNLKIQHTNLKSLMFISIFYNTSSTVTIDIFPALPLSQVNILQYRLKQTSLVMHTLISQLKPAV